MTKTKEGINEWLEDMSDKYKWDEDDTQDLKHLANNLKRHEVE